MTSEAQKPLRIFCSYSHKDEGHLNDLRDWLRGLERQGLIEWWHDRKISPGWEWEEVIDKNLRTADIILLLVSPALMASDYVYEKEIDRAIERHERGEARVIPIILRPADWEWASFGKLQALPKDAKPITRWDDRDEAWLDVLRGIRKSVEELLVERRERAATEWYRKAVEEAWADTNLSDAEAQQLGALASEQGLSTNITTDIEHRVMGDTKETILERQEQTAREREHKEQLVRLYAQARRSHQAQEWQAVVDIFHQMEALDPTYPDPEGLLESAREALEIAQRGDTLRQYREAVERAWTDEELSRREVKTLEDLANSLKLTPSTAAQIEREVMGETIEAILENQKRVARETERPPRERGRVKWYDAEKGYGFLVRPTGEDLFVHHSEVEGDISSLSPNDEVVYEVGRNERGPHARRVQPASQRTREFFAPTVDKALAKASSVYRLRANNLSYEVVDPGNEGFLGIGSRDARIVVETPKTARLITESQVERLNQWRGKEGVEQLENRLGMPLTDLTRVEADKWIKWIERLIPEERE